jgi:hypothetical protein
MAYLKAAKDGKVLTGEGTVHAAILKEVTHQKLIADVVQEVAAEVPGRDTKYFLFEHFSWDMAAPACKLRGKKMCSLKEICPHGKGKFPAITPLAGDHWLPISDEPNSWVSTGNLYMDRICGLHQDCCGKEPAWGEPGGKGLGGSVLICCGKDGEPSKDGKLVMGENLLEFAQDKDMGSNWGGGYTMSKAKAVVNAVAVQAAKAAGASSAAADAPIDTSVPAFFHSVKILVATPATSIPTDMQEAQISELSELYATALETEEKGRERERES